MYWVTKAGKLTAEELLRFLHALPLAVVLDNGSTHRSKVVQAALPGLWARRIYLYYLPPYSPELNAIEPAFRTIKHHELPERRYTTVPALRAAVDAACTTYEERLIAKHTHQPRLAA